MTNLLSRLTPIDKKYPTCIETRAKFTIYSHSESRSSIWISKFLGILPTESYESGDEIINSLGRTRVIPITRWVLSSENKVNSLDLRHHLNWIIDALTPAKDAILQLQTEEGIQMAVMCTWFSAVGHGGPTLWPEQMGALASFNIECTFDIYFFEGD